MAMSHARNCTLAACLLGAGLAASEVVAEDTCDADGHCQQASQSAALLQSKHVHRVAPVKEDVEPEQHVKGSHTGPGDLSWPLWKKNRKCRSFAGPNSYSGLTRMECQAKAAENGHEFFMFKNNMIPSKRKCVTTSECDSHKSANKVNIFKMPELPEPSGSCATQPSGWKDSAWDGCRAYGEEQWCTSSGGYGPAWQQDWGSFESFAAGGATAVQACCECGGGSATSCSSEPSGWKDSDDDGCESYSDWQWCTASGGYGSGWNPSWGHFSDFEAGGATALEACCECGGGSAAAPSPAGTPATSCATEPSGWKDIDGYECGAYHSEQWCTSGGDYGTGWGNWGTFADYAAGGTTAAEACCECGGGSVPTTPEPTPPPPPTPAPPPTSEPDYGTCGVKGTDDTAWPGLLGIVNGQKATHCEYRWQACLLFDGVAATCTCGGTLIAPNWVLTAAHCVHQKSPSSVKVTLGEYKHDPTWGYGTHDDPFHGTTIVYHLNRIIVHEGYDPNTVQNDVALLQMKESAAHGHCIGTACLPDESQAIQGGEDCFVSGWGTLASGGSQPQFLQEAEVTMLDNSGCGQIAHEITEDMVCAQGQNGGIVDSCQGDSGGPLVCKKDGSWFVHGVVSWGYGCASADYPGVYARVTHFTSWIQTNMQASLLEAKDAGRTEAKLAGDCKSCVAPDGTLGCQYSPELNACIDSDGVHYCKPATGEFTGPVQSCQAS